MPDEAPDTRHYREAVSDAIVVGGGIAGMVAARELAVAGWSVTLLEGSDRLGGKVASHWVAGLELDAGAESFATRNDTVSALIRELALGGDIVTPNPAGAWLQPATGPAHPLPRSGILGIPGTPMAKDVIDIIGAAGAFRAQLDSLLPELFGSRERFLGPLVAKRMGTRVLDRLVAPVTMGIHSRHPNELEIDRVAPGLRRALLKQQSLARAVLALRAQSAAGTSVAGIRGGIHRLVEVLREDLVAWGVDIRLGKPVRAFGAGTVTLADGEELGAGRCVIVAIPDAPATAGEAAQGRSVSISLATLVVRAAELDSAPRGTGLLVAASPNGVRAKALTHSSAKWPWLAESTAQHQHVLRLSYDADALGSADLTEVAEIARIDAERLLGIRIPPESIDGFARVDWNTAPPAETRADTDAPDGVFRVGESVSGTGLAAVIGHARSTAAEILSEFAGTPDSRGDDGHHDNQPDRQ